MRVHTCGQAQTHPGWGAGERERRTPSRAGQINHQEAGQEDNKQKLGGKRAKKTFSRRRVLETGMIT